MRTVVQRNGTRWELIWAYTQAQHTDGIKLALGDNSCRQHTQFEGCMGRAAVKIAVNLTQYLKIQASAKTC